MGLWVAGSTIWQLIVVGMPEPEVMGVVGVAALVATLVSVWLLMAYKDGDSNVRSVWLCSRNDAIGNVAVVVAAGFVWWLNSGIPDLIVAGVMSLLFLNSAQQILRQSYAEWRHARGDGHGHGHDH